MTQVTHESDELARMRRQVAQKLRDDLMALPDEGLTKDRVEQVVANTLHNLLSTTEVDYDVNVTADAEDNIQATVNVYPPQHIRVSMRITPDGVVAVPPASEESET